MIKADTVHILLLHQIQHRRHIVHIAAAQGKAEAHSLSDPSAVAHPLQGLGKGTLPAAKHIIGPLQTVKADPDIADPDVMDLLRHLRCNQGSVRRKRHTNPFFGCISRKNREILSAKGLSSAEEQRRHMKSCQIVDQTHSFLRRQFIFIVSVFRTGIAVAAV